MSKAQPRRIKTNDNGILTHLMTVGSTLLPHLRHYASWIGFLQVFHPAFLKKLPIKLLRISDHILPINRLVSGLRLINQTFSEPKGSWRRLVTLSSGLAGIGLGIAAIFLPPLGLVFAMINIINNSLYGFWHLGLGLIDKYSGAWKKRRDELNYYEKRFYKKLNADPQILNKYKSFKLKDRNNPLLADAYQDQDNQALSKLEDQILKLKVFNEEENAKLALKAYNTGIILLALGGIIMSFFPPTALVGASILIATSIHGIFFGYDLAGTWPTKIKNFFFGPTTYDSIEAIEKKAQVYKTTATVNQRLNQNNKSAEKKNEEKIEIKTETIHFSAPMFQDNYFDQAPKIRTISPTPAVEMQSLKP